MEVGLVRDARVTLRDALRDVKLEDATGIDATMGDLFLGLLQHDKCLSWGSSPA